MSRLRLGLCCIFAEQPIKFRNTTLGKLNRLGSEAGRAYQDELTLHNFNELKKAVALCRDLEIGSFRILSQLIPFASHPQWLFDLDRLETDAYFSTILGEIAASAKRHDLRLSMHPDQFVVLSSPKESVVKSSTAELTYHGALCEALGADVINVHGGGAYGDKTSALARFATNFQNLPKAVKSRLTVENDDRTYTPAELLPLCREVGIPLVYDVHHHRCHPDGLTVSEATEQAITTWNREPLLHVSSPAEGWDGSNPRKHHDYVDAADFPEEWRGLDQVVTVDVEARAKELAVLALRQNLQGR